MMAGVEKRTIYAVEVDQGGGRWQTILRTEDFEHAQAFAEDARAGGAKVRVTEETMRSEPKRPKQSPARREQRSRFVASWRFGSWRTAHAATSPFARKIAAKSPLCCSYSACAMVAVMPGLQKMPATSGSSKVSPRA